MYIVENPSNLHIHPTNWTMLSSKSMRLINKTKETFVKEIEEKFIFHVWTSGNRACKQLSHHANLNRNPENAWNVQIMNCGWDTLQLALLKLKFSTLEMYSLYTNLCFTELGEFVVLGNAASNSISILLGSPNLMSCLSTPPSLSNENNVKFLSGVFSEGFLSEADVKSSSMFVLFSSEERRAAAAIDSDLSAALCCVALEFRLSSLLHKSSCFMHLHPLAHSP